MVFIIVLEILEMEIKMKNNFENISLLIVGYDGYNDVWNHYFELLNKNWIDRPKTFLATNVLEPSYKNVKVIPCGENSEWSDKVRISLNLIDTKYVILLLEDFFTVDVVNNESLRYLIQIIEDNKIDYCKLLNQSKIKGKLFNGIKNLHIIDKNEKYGISLQPSIWNKNYLKSIIGDDSYNAWLFELKMVDNPIQNKEKINCLAYNDNILNIVHSIVQSKYLKSAVRELKKYGYNIDESERDFFSTKDTIKYRLKRFFSENIKNEILRKNFKKIGKKLQIDFVSDRIRGDK